MGLGFIGLGTMGAPMVLNLLKAGFKLKVYDVDSERVKKVVECGAEPACCPREVASESEFILLCLPSGTVSEEVTIGGGGVVQSAQPGSVIVELSTVPPSTVRKIASAAEPLGVDVLDAPVSGGRSGAEEATLTIMVGGRRDVFDRSIPILKAIGREIYYVGGLGSGQIVKLLNNMRVLIDLVTSRYMLEIGVKAGVDLKLLQEIINKSTGQSWVWTNWVPKFIQGQSLGATINIFNKDMTNAIEIAESFNVYPEVAMAALKEIKTYLERSMGGSDISAMFNSILRSESNI
ncbi:MAG: NAD(P)-dependent oxidoreductase [Candidatus Bathyarchaeia archaeon]